MKSHGEHQHFCAEKQINRVSCSVTTAQHHWTKKRKRENKDFLSKMHCNLVVEIMELNSPGSIGRRYINGYFMVPLFSLTDQSMLLSAILSDKLLLFSIWIYKSPVCFMILGGVYWNLIKKGNLICSFNGGNNQCSHYHSEYVVETLGAVLFTYPMLSVVITFKLGLYLFSYCDKHSPRFFTVFNHITV